MFEEKPQVEQEVFANEGEPPFGAVQSVENDYIVVYIENAGVVSIDASHVIKVHDGKVLVDIASMPEAVRVKILHAHDAEDG